jgi:hypothetical protein
VPDIEFVSGTSGEPDDPEELDGGGRRRVPIWLLAAVLAVIAAFVLVVVFNHAGRPTAAPAPSTSARSSVPATPASSGPLASYSYTPPLPQGVGQPFALGVEAHVFDVAVSAEGVWALTDHGLVVLLANGRSVTKGLSDTRLPPGYTSGSARLVVDQPANLIWVVVAGQSGGRVMAYQMVYRNRVVDVATPPINGAAALDGRLYLTSDAKVFSVSTGGVVRAAAILPATLGTIAADPSRNRLLVLDYVQHTSVWALAPRGNGGLRVGPPARVGVYPTGMVVVDGRIWIGGFDNGDGSLFRLAPDGLRAVRHSGIHDRFHTGAIPAAGGDSALWVRDVTGTTLHCIDARTGRDLQDWEIEGPVASRAGFAVVATTGGVVPLRLSECRG